MISYTWESLLNFVLESKEGLLTYQDGVMVYGKDPPV